MSKSHKKPKHSTDKDSYYERKKAKDRAKKLRQLRKLKQDKNP